MLALEAALALDEHELLAHSVWTRRALVARHGAHVIAVWSRTLTRLRARLGVLLTRALVTRALAEVRAGRERLVARLAAAHVLRVAWYVVTQLVAAHTRDRREERARRTLGLPVTVVRHRMIAVMHARALAWTIKRLRTYT